MICGNMYLQASKQKVHLENLINERMVFMKPTKITTPESVADKIFNLAVDKLEVYKDQNSECYVVIENEVLYFNNADTIHNRLRNLYFKEYNKTVKNTEIKRLMKHCCPVLKTARI